MGPITLGLAIEDEQLWNEVQSCLSDLPVHVVAEQRALDRMPEFLESLGRTQPDMVLLDTVKLSGTLDEAIRQIRAVSAESVIVALHTAADADSILRAFRAGVSEYLFPPLASGLRKAVQSRVEEREQRREEARPGARTIAILSVKGGCGATTIACHVAVELGRHKQKVLLADLDLEAGMVSFLMKAKSQYSILDAVENTHKLDSHFWKALVSTEVPGLDIISAPAMLAHQHAPSPEPLRQVLQFLRSQYDWVILDMGRSLDPLTVNAIEHMDEVFLVTTLEVPALHQTKQTVHALAGIGYDKRRLRLIVNRVPKRLDVTADEIEKIVGVAVYAMLPNNYPALHECYAGGKLLARGTDLAQHLARLAERIAGIPQEKPKRWLGIFGS